MHLVHCHIGLLAFFGKSITPAILIGIQKDSPSMPPEILEQHVTPLVAPEQQIAPPVVLDQQVMSPAVVEQRVIPASSAYQIDY